MSGNNTITYTKSLTFEDLVESLKISDAGFLAVIDKEKKLVGIVTDSDLRRAILNQTKSVDSIINFNPYFLNKNVPEDQISEFAIKNRIKHLPLVNDNHHLLEIYEQDNRKLERKDNPIVIMAGGLGKRLGELTKNVPKPMLRIKGKPILEYIIQSFIEEGYYRFFICVNYKYEVIQDYFGDGSSLDIDINYIKEYKKLGTAGAISLIDLDINKPFFVVNGDVLSLVNYSKMLEFFISSKADALMCIKEENYSNPYAVVNFDNKNNLLSIEEKPTTTFHFNSGIYILNDDVKKLLIKNEYFDMPDLFDKALFNKKRVKVFKLSDSWYDVGTQDEYQKLID